MERQKKVVDASVVVKWFAEEENVKEAVRIRDAHVSGEVSLIAPEFLVIEVLNALRYKWKDLDKLRVVNRDLVEAEIKFEKLTTSFVERALEISLEHNFSLYDSLYVALAQMYGVELVTDDKKLKKAGNVRLLSEV